MPTDVEETKSAVQPNSNLIGHLREFDVHNNDWTIFKPRLINFFDANSIDNEAKKRSVFLNLLSEDSYRLLFNLCLPKKPEEISFKVLIEIFNKHFGGQICAFAERAKFYSATKDSEESLKEWAARVRSLAVNCKFTTELQVMLRDRFIMGLPEGLIKNRLFEEDHTVTFEDAIRIASSKEASCSAMDTSVQPYCRKQEAGQVFQVRKFRSSEVPSSSKSSSCRACGRKNHNT